MFSHAGESPCPTRPLVHGKEIFSFNYSGDINKLRILTLLLLGMSVVFRITKCRSFYFPKGRLLYVASI